MRGLSPTDWNTTSEYVDIVEFKEGRLSHLTEVGDDVHAMRELGWGLQGCTFRANDVDLEREGWERDLRG